MAAYAAEENVATLPPPTEKSKPEASRPKGKKKPQKQPPYNVIIWNDEEHTIDFVIELLMMLFNHDFDTAAELTMKVHLEGRAVVFTTHKELAELKRDLVIAYKPHFAEAAANIGPLHATIEPAE